MVGAMFKTWLTVKAQFHRNMYKTERVGVMPNGLVWKSQLSPRNNSGKC